MERRLSSLVLPVEVFHQRAEGGGRPAGYPSRGSFHRFAMNLAADNYSELLLAISLFS
jgi:hypothetical protein